MHQQINLYQPVMAGTQQKLSATTLAVSIGALLVALTAYTIYVQIRVGHLDNDVAGLRAQVEQAQAAADEGSEAAPDDAKARATQLTASIDQRKRALELLQQGAAGRTTGFAERMEALARRHVDGLWIDRMTLSGINGSMSLGGVALDPAMVPTYLHTLAQEKTLSGIRFDEFIIERPPSKSEAATQAQPEQMQSDSVATARLPAGAVRFRAGSRELTPAAGDPS